MNKSVTGCADGFTPVFDCLLQDAEIGMIGALIFGRVWRYCQMAQRRCFASAVTLAKELGLTRQTVGKYLDLLVRQGYLEEAAQDEHKAGTPHVYRDTGKVRMVVEVSVQYDEPVNPVDTPVNGVDTPVNPVDTKIEYKKELRHIPTMSTLSDADASALKAKKQTKSSSDERRKTPAIQCAKAINDGRWPPKALWDDIIRILGPTPDGKRLAKCRKEWIERGYNPNSWKWLTQWYSPGIPPRGNGATGHETIMEKNQRVIAEYLEEAKNGESEGNRGDVITVDGSVAQGAGYESDDESV